MRRFGVAVAGSLLCTASCMQDFGIFDPTADGSLQDVTTPDADASPPLPDASLDGPIDSAQDAPADVVAEAGCNPAACPGHRCTRRATTAASSTRRRG